MKKITRLFRVGLVVFFYSISFSLAATNKVENVVVTEAEDGNSAFVVVESQLPLKYVLKEIQDPPTIELAIDEEISCDQEPFQQIGKKLIKDMKVVCQKGTSGKELLKTITLILDQNCSVKVSQKDWILSLDIKKGMGVVEPLPAAQGTETIVPLPASIGGYTTVDILEPPKMTLSMRPTQEEFIQVGLANHKGLEIAQSELKLSKRKLFESRRNFFPVLSGRGTQTEGTTQSDPNDASTRADFTRKEIGLEIGQPVFQSGRLLNAEKGAKVQAEIAETQISKITLEVQFEVIKALYTYLAAREALVVRKALQGDGDKVLDTTKKKKEIGVASESEYLGVLSSKNQIDYKTISQEKDMEIAKSRFLSLLNLDLLPDEIQVSIEESLAKVKDFSFELNQLISLALSNRPEVKIGLLSQRAKEYARKVSRAENLFKVDASGFIGQSGAAFRKESLSMKDSYNLALKGVLYFGGSSIAPMASTEKTAPDLGSASRTDTRAQTITVGLLDSLPAGSSLMQAKVEEEKAKEEFRKIRKDILLEVKEAYFNHQKAKVQIESAQKELEYRKKEAAIAQAKDRLHQIEATQFLQSLGSLKEAEISLKEASVFYITSYAALEKATGGKLTPIQ
ncbi:MAG: hypothetical protein A3I11_09390 [Elusimicrobia bacterium RIFCSPLOWO2_02_FULL_39_32]|nr:MAG: hypothetical protein A2034_02995 [Elusimicrobia bacterium GWA2_38_7]OGR78829.1 MAG: hypothetical protein A3B80_07540 [Elusimicrobia bacterium RIFCSPHIGHO2_02_FULL_39_36]OGR91869.1 MAG: hypothetical protein A3I11_09390 [Elusimicrobia bacterium RIFCSPLOWO2_02_FULL_39_32]OGR99087.1 MAG: hypothetical protein A3G85_08980 [Elusimicrobia bacterium RIFCSPLOWO2_12_FULL_39_28]